MGNFVIDSSDQAAPSLTVSSTAADNRDTYTVTLKAIFSEAFLAGISTTATFTVVIDCTLTAAILTSDGITDLSTLTYDYVVADPDLSVTVDVSNQTPACEYTATLVSSAAASHPFI